MPARLRLAKRVWACSICARVHDRPDGDGKKSRQCRGCGQLGAVRCFDSHAEYKRFSNLVSLQSLGVISGLQVQPRFELVVNGRKIADPWRADFAYTDSEGRHVIEDVKGVDEPYQRIRRTLAEAIHGIHVTIIGEAKRLGARRKDRHVRGRACATDGGLW